MSCCCDAKPKKGRSDCPECGQNPLPVSRQTMLHQIQFPDNQHIPEGDYAFCANNGCPVAYFSNHNMIQKEKLRAFQPNQTAMLCYCFDVSKSAYRKALKSNVSGEIKAFIVQQTKDKLCACEFWNPSGRCCLVDFKRMEDEYAG